MNEKLKRFFKTTSQNNCVSIALFILRLIVGIAFIEHGWLKIQSPGGLMGWAGPDAPIPGALQFLALFAEFGGGIALVIGLLTSLASLGLLITMTVATFMVMGAMHAPFVHPTGGMSGELGLTFWGISFLLMFTGAGKFSLDAKFFGTK